MRHHGSRFSWKMAMAGMAGLALLLMAGTASATDTHNPFSGTKTWALIGHLPVDGNEWIIWQNASTNECRFQYLGTGGLSDNYRVVFGNGGGSLLVMYTGVTPTSLCGYAVENLRYNGHSLDLIGGNGKDELASTSTGDTFIFGYGGDDRLYSGRIGANVYGGDGNDYVRTPPNNVARVDLGAGNDCLELLLWGVQATNMRVTCGLGLDTFVHWGQVPQPADCEQSNLNLCNRTP